MELTQKQKEKKLRAILVLDGHLKYDDFYTYNLLKCVYNYNKIEKDTYLEEKILERLTTKEMLYVASNYKKCKDEWQFNTAYNFFQVCD